MRGIPSRQKGCRHTGPPLSFCAPSVLPSWPAAHARLPMPEHSRSFPANASSHLTPARAQEAAKNPKFEDRARELKSKAERASTLGRLELSEDKTKRGAGSSGILNGILHDEKGGKFTVESEGGWNTGHAPHLHILTETHVFEAVAPLGPVAKSCLVALLVLARRPVDLRAKA
jgi:hypothetical protein